MVERGDCFSDFVQDVLMQHMMPDKLECKGASLLNELLTRQEMKGRAADDFSGEDYSNAEVLPVYLVLLINESVKRILTLTSTPFQYLSAVVNWNKLLYFYREYVAGLEGEQKTVKADGILLVETLAMLLENPLENHRVEQLKLLLDDLADHKEILEKISLNQYKVSQKATLEDLRRAVIHNTDVLRVFSRMAGRTEEQFETECLPKLMGFSDFYLLKKDTYIGQSYDASCSKTFPNGMIAIYEASLPLSRRRRSPQVTLARILMAILHENGNYIKKIIRDEGRVFPRAMQERTRVDAEYFLEKALFSRYNFHHVLADIQPNNKSLLNKISRVLLAPERWAELHFCSTVKNMTAQLIAKDIAGYDILAPSFKKLKGDQDWDETLLALKREDDSAAPRKGSMQSFSFEDSVPNLAYPDES